MSRFFARPPTANEVRRLEGGAASEHAMASANPPPMDAAGRPFIPSPPPAAAISALMDEFRLTTVSAAHPGTIGIGNDPDLVTGFLYIEGTGLSTAARVDVFPVSPGDPNAPETINVPFLVVGDSELRIQGIGITTTHGPPPITIPSGAYRVRVTLADSTVLVSGATWNFNLTDIAITRLHLLGDTPHELDVTPSTPGTLHLAAGSGDLRIYGALLGTGLIVSVDFIPVTPGDPNSPLLLGVPLSIDLANYTLLVTWADAVAARNLAGGNSSCLYYVQVNSSYSTVDSSTWGVVNIQ